MPALVSLQRFILALQSSLRGAVPSADTTPDTVYMNCEILYVTRRGPPNTGAPAIAQEY